MLRTGAPAAAGGQHAPEEVKLYAQEVAANIHGWAELVDVRRIVEDIVSKVPGLVLDRGRLRRAVCKELEQREDELREQYKQKRIRQQQAVEQMVRERAADRRKTSVVSRRAAAAREIIPVSGTQHRKRLRDDTSDELREVEANLKKLRGRGAPKKPAGAKPTRTSRLGPWKTRMRAHEKHVRQVAELQGEREKLRKELGEIGMSRVMFTQEMDHRMPPPPGAHAIVPSSPRMTGTSTGCRRAVYERGREQAAAEPERLRRKARDECAPGGQFTALAPYCGLPEVDPLACYYCPQLPDNLKLTLTRQTVEDRVSAHPGTAATGRSRPQTAATERNAMMATTDADGEDYLLWGRPVRQRLEMMKASADQQGREHAAKQLRHRGRRQVDLENAAEMLEAQPLARGSKAFRVQQALRNKPSQLLVITPSQAAPAAAALSDTHAVLIWVPDDDPRPGMTHGASIGWHLERDLLDWAYPQANGKPRSSKTEGCRHRQVYMKRSKGETQSRPVAIVIAATTAVTTPHYRTMLALQQGCGLAVIVCDPGCADVAAAGGLDEYVKSHGAKKRKSASEKAAAKKDRKNQVAKSALANRSERAGGKNPEKRGKKRACPFVQVRLRGKGSKAAAAGARQEVIVAAQAKEVAVYDAL